MTEADSDEHRLYAYLQEKAVAGQLRVTVQAGRILLHCPGDGLTVVAAEFPDKCVGLDRCELIEPAAA